MNKEKLQSLYGALYQQRAQKVGVEMKSQLLLAVSVLILFGAATYVLYSLWYNIQTQSNVIGKNAEENTVTDVQSEVISNMAEQDPVTLAMQYIINSSGDRTASQCVKFDTWASNFSMSDEFQSNVEEFVSAVRERISIPRNLRMPLKTKYLYRVSHYLASTLKFVRTICETGVGQSSFNFLKARRDVIVYSFNVGVKLEELVLFLRKQFPNRLKVFYGDSRETLPLFFTRYPSLPPVTCDLILVNGGHEGDVPLHDIRNFARAASQPHNVIIMDDMHVPDVRAAWEVAVGSGVVKQLLTCTYWAVGVIIQHKNSAQ